MTASSIVRTRQCRPATARAQGLSALLFGQDHRDPDELDAAPLDAREDAVAPPAVVPFPVDVRALEPGLLQQVADLRDGPEPPIVGEDVPDLAAPHRLEV